MKKQLKIDGMSASQKMQINMAAYKLKTLKLNFSEFDRQAIERLGELSYQIDSRHQIRRNGHKAQGDDSSTALAIRFLIGEISSYLNAAPEPLAILCINDALWLGQLIQKLHLRPTEEFLATMKSNLQNGRKIGTDTRKQIASQNRARIEKAIDDYFKHGAGHNFSNDELADDLIKRNISTYRKTTTLRLVKSYAKAARIKYPPKYEKTTYRPD